MIAKLFKTKQNKTKTKTTPFKTKTNLISCNRNEVSLDQSYPVSLPDIYFSGLYGVQPLLSPGLRGLVFHNLLFSSPDKNRERYAVSPHILSQRYEARSPTPSLG